MTQREALQTYHPDILQGPEIETGQPCCEDEKKPINVPGLDRCVTTAAQAILNCPSTQHGPIEAASLTFYAYGVRASATLIESMDHADPRLCAKMLGSMLEVAAELGANPYELQKIAQENMLLLHADSPCELLAHIVRGLSKSPDSVPIARRIVASSQGNQEYTSALSVLCDPDACTTEELRTACDTCGIQHRGTSVDNVQIAFDPEMVMPYFTLNG